MQAWQNIWPCIVLYALPSLTKPLTRGPSHDEKMEKFEWPAFRSLSCCKTALYAFTMVAGIFVSSLIKVVNSTLVICILQTPWNIFVFLHIWHLNQLWAMSLMHACQCVIGNFWPQPWTSVSTSKHHDCLCTGTYFFSWFQNNRPLIKDYTHCRVMFLIPGGLFDGAAYCQTSCIASDFWKRVQYHQNSQPAMCVIFHEGPIILESAVRSSEFPQKYNQYEKKG